MNDLEKDHSAFKLSEKIKEKSLLRFKIIIFTNKLINDRELEQQRGIILDKPITYNNKKRL